ncbi:hypothetical protein D3C77_251110 [compost metagenome]
MDTAAQAHPLDLVQQVTEALFDGAQHLVEQAEVAVLAVVVEHEAGDLLDHRFDFDRIPLAQAAERPRRIGQQVVGAAHLRVDAQATDLAFGGVSKALQLADGVEDDLVAVIEHFLDFIVGPGHAVGVGLAGELLATQLELVERRRGGAVHVLLHQVEHRPGGEALECQQGLGPGLLAHVGDLLHVAQQLGFVDEVVRRFDHFEAPGKAGQKKDTHCALPCPKSKERKALFPQSMVSLPAKPPHFCESWPCQRCRHRAIADTAPISSPARPALTKKTAG